MEKLCPICALPFKDGEDIVAVMRSTYKKIESDIHYAITTPTECFEIIHEGCYDFPDQDRPDTEGMN